MKRVAEDNEVYSQEKRLFMNEKSAVAVANEAAARLNQKIGLSPNVPAQQNGCTTQTVHWSIPDKYVGLIIGKQGLQISTLQNESHCKVQISPEGGKPERAITLIGTPHEIDTAKEMIQGIIGRAERSNLNPMNQMANMPNVNDFQVEIRVPGNKAGLVIGRNGETIKNLQEEHGVKMVLVQQTNAATLEDKPLRITGERSKVERVKHIVNELINSRDPRKPADGQDVRRYAVPAEKAGLIIGKSGESIKEICRMSGAHVEISKEPLSDPSIKIFNIRGGPNEMDQAIRMISDRAGIAVTQPATSISTPSNYFGYAQDPNAAYPGSIPPPSYNPYTGQPDYSAAWIEYYRRLGMHDQAEAIQRQAQQQAQAYSQAAIAGAQAAPGAPQPGLAPQAAATPGFPATAAASGVQPGANQADYAWHQWQQQQQQQWQWQQQQQPQQWQGNNNSNSASAAQPGQRHDGLNDNII